MQLPIAPPFLDAVLLRVGLFHFIMAWSGIGAALGLMALIVEDALRRMSMRKEEEIRAKVAECIDNLRELADEIDFDAEDLIVYDRSELHLSTLLWALNEPPPEEVQKLADSVLQKFRQAKGLPDDWPKGSLKRKKN